MSEFGKLNQCIVARGAWRVGQSKGVRRRLRRLTEENCRLTMALYNSLEAQELRHHPLCKLEGCTKLGKRSLTGFCSREHRHEQPKPVANRTFSGIRNVVKAATGKSLAVSK